MKYGIFLFGILLILSGCGTTGTDEAASYGTTPGGVPTSVDFATLSAQVLTPNCIQCHSGFATESVVLLYVEAGSPTTSTLYTIVASGEMPKNGPRLSSQKIALIENYINGLSP